MSDHDISEREVVGWVGMTSHHGNIVRSTRRRHNFEEHGCMVLSKHTDIPSFERRMPVEKTLALAFSRTRPSAATSKLVPKTIYLELVIFNAVAVTWVLFFDFGPKDRAVHGESGGGVHRIHFAHTFWRTQRIAHFISRSP